MAMDGSHESAPAAPVLLIVDDDAAVLNSLKFCLEIEGFAVRVYGNAETILKDPDLPGFGCLVLDYHLPDMTGLELLARLRSNGVQLPAVLITGRPGHAQRRHAEEAGIVMVEKPLLGNGLIDAIRGALGLPMIQ